MEKYSAYRDPGTGVQPFLPLVPPPSTVLSAVALPIAWLVGILRVIVVLALVPLHFLLACLCLPLTPIPILHRFVAGIFTAITARLALLSLGVFWISVENVSRKRSARGVKESETWQPRAGDIIVSNWVSWIEILWLAFRFNPVFVLPVTEAAPAPALSSRPADAISHTPGRRTGTGSANIQAPSRAATARIPIAGFRQVSLLSALLATGRTPPFAVGVHHSLEELRSASPRPLVVFPECTTSNGRALLRVADVFQGFKVPVQDFNVFVMCVRFDPPTRYSGTLAHSIPTSFNPFSHVWSVATSLAPQAVSIRLLAPSESPGSQLFLASEILAGLDVTDPLGECCGSLIAQIGKMKRTGLGWEDKSRFLDLFRDKQKK